jgi:putative oxygen-independent coproporphyrinogen III oxidase
MQKLRRQSVDVSQALSFYIHIPYCAKRCGYCDFNTYTPRELQGPDIKTVSQSYIDAAVVEIELAASQVGRVDVPTIFFGGGTPSLLPAKDLERIIGAIKNNFDLSDSPEITIEVNPDSVSQEFLDAMRVAGATRISMGMQSAVPHVLATLDRTHTPENVERAVSMVRYAGFDHCSVDLIYGVPGESMEDWKNSVASALALDIDHLSAYALIVESGTRLAQRVKSGELVIPPDDETAEKYLYVDQACEAAGMSWYEISNWAKSGAECRHNIAYWNGSQWWGVGPGAHSFVGQKRWWNVKHPAKYQSLISARESVIDGSEHLSAENREDEYLMLTIRMREGIPLERLSESQRMTAERFCDSEHLDQSAWRSGRVLLTRSGRLIADRIVREMLV